MFEGEEPRRWKGYWKEGCIALTILSIVLIVALIAVSASKNPDVTENQSNPIPQCATGLANIDLSEPDVPPLFADLTQKELRAVRKYLSEQPHLNIVSVNEAIVNSSYVYLVELIPPPKVEALLHLDNNGPSPERWAKAVLFRGDLDTPVIEEYRVGPMPTPSTHEKIDYGPKRKNPIPFAYRPLSRVDIDLIDMFIFPKIVDKTGKLLFESFGAGFLNCDEKCLTYSIVPVSTSNFGTVVRKFWMNFGYYLEFVTLHPLDFQVLVNLDGVDLAKYRIEMVWYNDKHFETLDDLLETYKSGGVDKISSSFPTDEENQFSTLNLRGQPFPSKPLRSPKQVEPDGKRYSIRGQHVEYLGWTFNYRLCTSMGPMLFDVRYRGKRIAYEISLQEIAVFYSARGPAVRFSDVVDSASMVGVLSKTLVPGGDCPDSAVFLPARHLSVASDSPIVYENAMCIFEQATGNPLRRHHSHSTYDGSFYEGLMDDVLVLRTILTVGNYDYVFDYIFHQNGAVEVKGMATGYILASAYTKVEDKFGFQIHKNLLGNIHHHMFNFKVDIDIHGTSNRFETLDIGVDKTPNEEFSPLPTAATYNQIKLQRNLRKKELSAAYKFNFDAPKYLLFHNERVKTAYQVPRAYRVLINGMSKQLLPEGEGHEPSISWARYQMAVTKFNEAELQSSSQYAIWDAVDPVNNFQTFLDDDEDIVDQDLVAWISLGVHHIPHTEDLPVTPTVGGHVQFFLLPYNYFDEDPAISSRNAVRIELRKGEGSAATVNVNRHDVPNGVDCVAEPSDFDDRVKENPHLIFA